MPNALGLIHPVMLTALRADFFPSSLTIQGATEGRSASGAVTVSWLPVAGLVNLPCRIAPQSGSENRTPQQILTQDVQTCVVPQPLAGVTTKHRAQVDGRTFDIVSVDFDGQQQPGSHRRLTRLTLRVVS